MKVEVDHIKLSKRISRMLFGNQPMKTKVVKSKKVYSRKSYKKPV